jgi:hypothetical protein
VAGWYLIGADATFARSPFGEADAQFLAAARSAGGLRTGAQDVSR